MSNSTNSSTLSPDAQAFVNNTKAIITGAGVLGGVTVFIILGLFICCKMLKSRVSDESRQGEQEKRRLAYASRQAQRDEEAQKIAGQAHRGKSRPGFVEAYDPNLEKSFAAAITGDHDPMMLESDEDEGPAVAAVTEVRSNVVEVRSEHSEPRSERERSESALMADASIATTQQEASAATSAVEDIAAPYRRTLPPMLSGAVLRQPLPRNAVEEDLRRFRGAHYLAVVEQMKNEDAAKETRKLHERSAVANQMKRHADQRDREGQSILSGLSSPERAAARGLDRRGGLALPEARLGTIPVQRYLEHTL